jgi:hypothetical protein
VSRARIERAREAADELRNWLARRWCNRFGHPEKSQLTLVVGNQCEDCVSEHTVSLTCCGRCLRAIGEVEYS